MDVSEVEVENILTRTSGFLETVTSHSLQPYRGCSYGNSLCGVGCYVQHSYWVTKGREWGSFLEVRSNAADAYLGQVERERRWARERRGSFNIFMSSATDPFVPQETRYGVTTSLLETMVDEPPDQLILQTHSQRVRNSQNPLARLRERCEVRVHLSIETDRESVDGLPPHASSVEDRFTAAKQLHDSGHQVTITVSPLLPIAEPERFFARIADSATSVIIDHFIEGDGSADGSRTRKTILPEVLAKVEPASVGLDYREEMVRIASRHLPGRVGVSSDGFAGRFQI